MVGGGVTFWMISTPTNNNHVASLALLHNNIYVIYVLTQWLLCNLLYLTQVTFLTTTKKMKILQIIRIVYHLVAFTIQEQESLYKYFQRPVVIQESWTNVGSIEKADLQVCIEGSFHYEKAFEFGYYWLINYLIGMIPNSTKPTWMGIHQNSTFKEINNVVLDKDFSQISVNQPSKLSYEMDKFGFCLHTTGTDDALQVTTKDKKLSIFIVHSSTDSKICSDRSLQFLAHLGFTSNTSFDYKVYELSVEVHDNTIHDGTTCVDYRKHDETYGKCNYEALKNYFYISYGCYPPWLSDESEDKLCEIGIKGKAIGHKLLNKSWEYIDMLTDGRKIDIMKQCKPPCYKIKTKLKEKINYPYNKKYAQLIITNTQENAKIFKAVYSFDIFMLTVELGSALGLWLGTVILLITINSDEM